MSARVFIYSEYLQDLRLLIRYRYVLLYDRGVSPADVPALVLEDELRGVKLYVRRWTVQEIHHNPFRFRHYLLPGIFHRLLYVFPGLHIGIQLLVSAIQLYAYRRCEAFAFIHRVFHLLVRVSYCQRSIVLRIRYVVMPWLHPLFLFRLRIRRRLEVRRRENI